MLDFEILPERKLLIVAPAAALDWLAAEEVAWRRD